MPAGTRIQRTESSSTPRNQRQLNAVKDTSYSREKDEVEEIFPIKKEPVTTAAPPEIPSTSQAFYNASVQSLKVIQKWKENHTTDCI